MYDYFLPPAQIALEPVAFRDRSKLFVYNTATNKVDLDHFNNLAKYLPQNSFLVLNNTKVLPARVELKKQTGGKVIVLFLLNEKTEKGQIKAMVDRKINIGDILYIDEDHFFTVNEQQEHFFDLNYHFDKEWFLKKLYEIGKTPIPLYLRKTSLSESELRQKYQTIFAENQGSVAAPTASLHFTDKVLNDLDEKGIKKLFITLHVGLGTFAPITQENINQKKLHEEYYEVDWQTLKLINELKSKGKKLISVGTTVTRTLESIVRVNPDPLVSPERQNLLGKTDLFIMPPYHFQMADILLTNFHLPKSSLMMLVEAFLQHKNSERHLVDLYKIAIEKDFRFYSFGDAMLII